MGTVFDGSLIGDNWGFVYQITNLTNERQYIGRKYFWQKRKPKGGKRRVTSEVTGSGIMGHVQNSKTTSKNSVKRILVEPYSPSMGHQEGSTMKKQDNFFFTTF